MFATVNLGTWIVYEIQSVLENIHATVSWCHISPTCIDIWKKNPYNGFMKQF